MELRIEPYDARDLRERFPDNGPSYAAGKREIMAGVLDRSGLFDGDAFG